MLTEGMSSFADKTAIVGTHLMPLLDFASKAVPSYQHEDTPIFLFATAGMRLVPQRAQEELMREACIFSQQNYRFSINSCKAQFRIISGDLEGYSIF